MQIKNSISRKRMVGTRLLFSLAALLSASACQTDQAIQIRDALAIYEDRPYYQSYLAANRQFEVVQNFETKQQISATLLTNAFRQSIAQRHKAIYLEAQPVLGEVTDQTGFFVSSFIPGDDLSDLRNSRLWNIVLETPTGTLRPTLIKKLTNKEQWQVFFPKVNLWTEEYLILFAGSSALSNDQLVKKESITLSLANKHATTLLTW